MHAGEANNTIKMQAYTNVTPFLRALVHSKTRFGPSRQLKGALHRSRHPPVFAAL